MRRTESPEDKRKRIERKNNQAIYASRKKRLAKDMEAFIRMKELWNVFQEWRETQ